MNQTEIEIATGSGPMKTVLFSSGAEGRVGAVVLLVDGGGLRQSQLDIAGRIAKMGYLVAVPDLFHRSGAPVDLVPAGRPRTMASFEGLFGDAEFRQSFFTKYYGPAIAYENLRDELTQLFAALDARPDFNGKIGTTGYCMGGNASLRVATLFGDRIAAAAAFHGGGLVTDDADSPHLRAKDIRAKVYVAGAIEDGSFTDEAKATLVAAFDAAHVDATVETYPAKHGFAVSDHSTYDEAAARRHDEALARLYAATLR